MHSSSSTSLLHRWVWFPLIINMIIIVFWVYVNGVYCLMENQVERNEVKRIFELEKQLAIDNIDPQRRLSISTSYVDIDLYLSHIDISINKSLKIFYKLFSRFFF